MYIKEVIKEFRYIRWLPVVRAASLSVFVIIVSVAAGFALGAVDNGFAVLLRGVII